MMAPGQMLAGRYRLLRLLGGGGMGAVWAAKNEAIDRDVAIKVMLPALADDPTALQRFFTEARICGSIRHPGIVDVLDLGSAEDGSPFLVMEILEGESLETRLFRQRRLPPSAILPIVRDVARTIALAHQKDIVHRDLKPANIFLHRPESGPPVVKVLDFGISKVLTPGAAPRTTQTGAVVGSPAYMSPEQALGRLAIDHRTDIYALGVILYEALTGRLPFDGDNYNALIVDIATASPPDVADLVPGLPAPIAQLVRDAMQRDREKRIGTTTALAERIEALLPLAAEADEAVRRLVDDPTVPAEQVVIGDSGSATLAMQKTASTLTTSVTLPRRPRWWLPVGAAVAAAAIAVGAVLLSRPPNAAPIATAIVRVPAIATVTTTSPGAGTTADPGSGSAPTVSPGPTVVPSPSASANASANAPPSASASAPPAPVKSAAAPGGKAPPKPRGSSGAWGYD